jgi:hypothetical protein
LGRATQPIDKGQSRKRHREGENQQDRGTGETNSREVNVGRRYRRMESLQQERIDHRRQGRQQANGLAAGGLEYLML